MAAADLVPMEGTIVDVLKGGSFKVLVRIPNKDGTERDHFVLARLSGKMVQNKIRVVLGDRVKLGVSPNDLTRGRIEFRFKD